MTALGRRVFKGWMGEDPQQQLEEKEEAEEEAREKAEQAEEKAREKAERAEEMAARDAAREASRKAARAEERAEAAARQLAKQMQEANRTKFSRLLAAFNAYEAERKKTKQKAEYSRLVQSTNLKKDIWALRTKADAFVSSEADSLRNWEKPIEMMKEVKEMIEIVNLGVWNDGHNEIALNMLKERLENFRKENTRYNYRRRTLRFGRACPSRQRRRRRRRRGRRRRRSRLRAVCSAARTVDAAARRRPEQRQARAPRLRRRRRRRRNRNQNLLV